MSAGPNSIRVAPRTDSSNSNGTDPKLEPDTPALAMATIEGLLMGCRSMPALETVHQAIMTEVVACFGAPAAVQLLGKALLALQFEKDASVGREAEEGDAEGCPPRTKLPVLNGGTAGLHIHNKVLWKKAVKAVLDDTHDVWADRGISQLPTRLVKRHRYRSCTDGASWAVDEVLVKMEDAPFAAGAMRECFATKKLSSFTNSVALDWRKAGNFVAKRYKRDMPDEVYFADVKLQMDAKGLGELYNRTDPPKKIDVMQVCVIEVLDLEDDAMRMFCLENLIEGDYIKYNSNSGFVDDVARNTPQAFSHYSYIVSEGQKLCVDIQGVGDLYTDPQIHTLDGKGYGDGDLGPRGMAYFFRSHECNPLCQRLEMEPFHRCDADVRAAGMCPDSTTSSNNNGHTVSRSFQRSRTLQAELQAALLESVSKVDELRPFDRKATLQALADVPEGEHMHARIHLEVAKLHGEVLALAELHTEDQQRDAMLGALFHLNMAATQGSPLALCVLARVFWGLPPTSSILANVVDRLRDEGFVDEDADVALRYAELAAERGVRNAAAALANSGAPANISDAIRWLDLSTGPPGPPEAEEEAACFPGAEAGMHERVAARAALLLLGGPGLPADPRAAAEGFNAAAELAMEACNGRMAQLYYERAAAAEGALVPEP